MAGIWAFAERVSLQLGWGLVHTGFWGVKIGESRGRDGSIDHCVSRASASRTFFLWGGDSLLSRLSHQPRSLFPSGCVLLSAVLGTTEELPCLAAARHAQLLDGCTSLGRRLHPPYRQ